MIAVKGGKTDLTDTLLRGGCDVDVQENVSQIASVCALAFETLFCKVGSEHKSYEQECIMSR